MPVLSAVFPVIAIAALGWLSRRAQWLNLAEAAAVERLCFWFLIPCLLFLGTATAAFPSSVNWPFLLGFYGSVALVYALGLGLGRLLFGYGLRELSVFGMAGAYSNVTVLGIPLVVELLGEAAFVPLFLLIAVHNLLLFSAGTVLAQWRNGDSTSLRAQLRRVGREMLLNPISGSLLAGATWNLLHLPFPAEVEATLRLLGQAAVPGALFALGAALTRYRVRGDILPALVLVVLKLVVLPLVVWTLLSRVRGLDAVWLQTAVLLACMPVGISVYVFSRRYERCEAPVAAAIVLSSLGAILSITAVAAWLLPA